MSLHDDQFAEEIARTIRGESGPRPDVTEPHPPAGRRFRRLSAADKRWLWHMGMLCLCSAGIAIGTVLLVIHIAG